MFDGLRAWIGDLIVFSGETLLSCLRETLAGAARRDTAPIRWCAQVRYVLNGGSQFVVGNRNTLKSRDSNCKSLKEFIDSLVVLRF